MKLLFILCGILSVNQKIFCQLPVTNPTATANQYIEGARLVIDILQLFRKNSSERVLPTQKNKGAYCNFCLFNSDTTQKIKVTLLSRNIQANDTLIMVIKPKDKECSLQIQCGVYNCKIETTDEKIISWGDIFINEKEIIVSR